MSKEIRLSVSQLKKINSHPWDWYFEKFKNIKKDQWDESNLCTGIVFEHRLMTWEENFEQIIWRNYSSEKVFKDFTSLKHNSIWLEFERGKSQVEVSWKILWVDFIWYLDNLLDWCIDDIKTCTYLTKKEWWNINDWSGMTTYEEYELTMWCYMKLTWINYWRIIEIAKYKYKDEDRHEHQILEFNMTPEWDKLMEERVNNILEIANKYIEAMEK